MLAAVVKISPDDAFDGLKALLAFDALRVETQIEERAVMEG